MSTTIRVEPIAGTRFVEDKDQARRLRRELMLPALEAGEAVVVDFGRVDTTTQSFVHALISEAIQLHGETAVARIRFRNCSGEIQQLITTVVEYTFMALDEAAELRQDERSDEPSPLTDASARLQGEPTDPD